MLLISVLCACAGQPPVVPDPFYATVEPGPPSLTATPTGSIYQPDFSVELFRDRRAYRVGDVLTVVLTEKTDASTSASTTTSKDDDIDISAPIVFGRPVTHRGDEILTARIDASRAFDGSGDTTQSNSLQGDISVSVVRVLANGNLEIRGEKIISINQGTEYVRLVGIVRPEDIESNNAINSNKVANARISYGGGGAIADANTQGWLGRFFNSPFWPF